MSAPTLGMLRQAARSNVLSAAHGTLLAWSDAPLDTSGRPVLAMWRTPIACTQQVTIEVLKAASGWHHAIAVKVHKGTLRDTSSRTHDAFVAWTDGLLASKPFTVEVVDAGVDQELRIWNKWRLPAQDPALAGAWSNNAGVLVDERTEHETVLRFSDGIGGKPACFDDFIVRVFIGQQVHYLGIKGDPHEIMSHVHEKPR